ncbi:MAG: glutamate--tRNA ligase [candidate division Zixibacteria bacterium]|nr:glutamate--tRNA ligase [candidate division Zixibacteria bacterium]
MTFSETRVRIAPSPTGYFHVGTARTAIFNWLYARRTGGKFLLRIEDTDVERSRKEYVDVILDGLRWLGMDWDGEVVYQSSRLQSYRPFALELIERDCAYRCFCTAGELTQKRQTAQQAKVNYHYDRNCRNLSAKQITANLEANKSYVVRLKLPLEGKATFDDVVLGKLEKDYHELDDFIILKSDGNAIYNFAVVIDDHDMGISHVIRGNDHMTNTFLQVEIYKALRWDIPTFAHLPMILDLNRNKVSKRKGAKGITDYQHEGYLPEALFNFLTLLGWSPKDDREKMLRQELVDVFTLEGINPSNAVFNPEKLLWLNGEYIREKTNHEIAVLVAPMLIDKGLTTKYYLETRWQWLMKVVGLLKERCKLVTDFAQMSSYFFTDNFEYDAKGAAKHFTPEAVKLLTALGEKFAAVSDLTEIKAEEIVRTYAEELQVKPAVLIHPTRLAVTGLTAGPSLFGLLEAIGRDKVCARIARAIVYIEKAK